MSEIFGELSKELNKFVEDLGRLVKTEEEKEAARLVEEDNKNKKSTDKQNVPEVKERRLRSMQRVTTFYKSEKEAREAKENPISEFVYKRMKEIFGK